MHDFPSFMKNPINRIDPASQHTPGVEGYVYDGVDGSQMAVRTYRESAPSGGGIHAASSGVLSGGTRQIH